MINRKRKKEKKREKEGNNKVGCCGPPALTAQPSIINHQSCPKKRCLPLHRLQRSRPHREIAAATYSKTGRRRLCIHGRKKTAATPFPLPLLRRAVAPVNRTWRRDGPGDEVPVGGGQIWSGANRPSGGRVFGVPISATALFRTKPS